MTDWKQMYEDYIVQLRKMKLSGGDEEAGKRLGYVMHQLGEHGETLELMVELPIAFKAFHTRLARAKIRAVT